MNTLQILLTVGLGAGIGALTAILLVMLLKKSSSGGETAAIEARLTNIEKVQEKTERAVREELLQSRTEANTNAKDLRGEVNAQLTDLSKNLLIQVSATAKLQQDQFDSFSKNLQAFTRSNETKNDKLRETLDAQLRALQEKGESTAKLQREEMNGAFVSFRDGLTGRLLEIATQEKNQLDTFATALKTQSDAFTAHVTTILTTHQASLDAMRVTIEKKFDETRLAVEQKLSAIQEDNGKKLEEMRKTVDEKLHATLEKRLGESFKQVSDRLELVHKGLGEMQNLATGVGDLKRVLSNVKSRGNLGELQLQALLEDIMTREQYEINVPTKQNSKDTVEFAIKLPAKDKAGSTIWLPIDSKWPQEDYERLMLAQEQGDAELVKQCGAALESAVEKSAKDINEKYLDPPYTTDFGIMFLPVESLFAEILRRPGLCKTLQKKYRVVVTGPTTLSALLNSLQMGFRTLAIEKRSSEVWQLLGAVKTEFGKFGDILEKTQKKLQEASNTIEDAARKSRTIQRKLKGVEELNAPTAAGLLASDDDDIAIVPVVPILKDTKELFPPAE
jgi:DNA recombination protein RmuC